MKVKVVHFAISETFGGIESFLYEIYKRSNDENIQMDFVAVGYKNGNVNKFRGIGATVNVVSELNNYGRYKADVAEVFSSYQSEQEKNGQKVIIHFHKNSAADMTAIRIAKKLGLKIIVHSHNTAPSTGNLTKLLHVINRQQLRRTADYKVACSKAAAEWMFKSCDDVRIIYNGIDTNRFKPNKENRSLIRDELGIPQDSVAIVCVGRFTKQKNQMWLIYFMGLAIQYNVYLILIGEGELKECCMREAEERGLISNIRFLGHRNDIPDLLNASDVFILPSLYEGYPISALEAQACGLKTFLSDRITKEVDVTGDVNWFSLDQNYEYIVKMMLDKDNQTQCRQQSYDLSTTYRMISDLYKEIAKI